MLLLIDNYDSFTYNLVHAFRELGVDPVVYRNDHIAPEALAEQPVTALVISPGPRTPAEVNASKAFIEAFAGRVPILGVNLGHQCIAEVFGGRVIRHRIMHGKTCEVYHDGTGLYEGIPSPFTATRYDSLIVDSGSLGDALVVTSRTAEGEIMGIRHRELPVEGVQFHPESIFTPWGNVLFANFLRRHGFEVDETAARPREEILVASIQPTGSAAGVKEGSFR